MPKFYPEEGSVPRGARPYELLDLLERVIDFAVSAGMSLSAQEKETGVLYRSGSSN